MSSQEYFEKPRKRQNAEHQLLQSKRQKRGHRSQLPIHPPEFYDNLSKVWLTKDALKELNRRNNSTPTFPAACEASHETLQPDVHFLHSTSKVLNEIKLFAKHGGPDLRDLRGHPEPGSSDRQTKNSSHLSLSRSQERESGSDSESDSYLSNSTESMSTKSSGIESRSSRPGHPSYKQKLIDGGILPVGYTLLDYSKPPKPRNWQKLNQRLRQRRPSLSPSRFPETEYEDYVQQIFDASNEAGVKRYVIRAMFRAMGICDDDQMNISFSNMKPALNNIARAKPDYYWGAHTGLINIDVRNDLGQYITPSKYTHLPNVPNMTLEVKGPRGSLETSIFQACHNGAIGAKAMHKLHTYRQDKPNYDNNTHTISAVYHGSTLTMYGHSIDKPKGPKTKPRYYMNQIGAWAMAGDRETFLRGATAFKNALDWTKESREAAITHANAVALQAASKQAEE